MGGVAAKPCRRCELLPQRVEGQGRLFVWLPLSQGFGKLVRHLMDSGREYRVLAEGSCVSVRLEGAALEPLGVELLGVLSSREAEATRVLFMEGDAEPRLADFPRVGSLAQLTGLSRTRWLVDMLAEQRITTHYQPIVHARDTHRVFAHEALLRGIEPNGALVEPLRMLALAREVGMLSQLDLAARLSAVHEANRLGLRTPLFINFTPAAIYDPALCLRSTVAALSELGLPPQDVVFEVIESDHTSDAQHLRTLIAYYRQEGFRVALDDLGAGFSSLNLVHQLRPDIVKLDMELIRGIHEDPYKSSITQKLLELAQELGILTVAEGIETPEELRWVRALGVDFVQGFLIARPRNPPVSATPRLND